MVRRRLRSGAAPFSATLSPRFRNGQRVSDADALVLRSLLHPVAKEWLDNKVAEVAE
jgi:hypothetical protein